MYDIWLCDDEAVHLRGLEEKIARILPDVRLQSFEDPEAVREAARACLPDILIMDIEFGPTSGIALADDPVRRGEQAHPSPLPHRLR